MTTTPTTTTDIIVNHNTWAYGTASNPVATVTVTVSDPTVGWPVEINANGAIYCDTAYGDNDDGPSDEDILTVAYRHIPHMLLDPTNYSIRLIFQQ